MRVVVIFKSPEDQSLFDVGCGRAQALQRQQVQTAMRTGDGEQERRFGISIERAKSTLLAMRNCPIAFMRTS
jgi:hypothetical protein